MSLALVRIEGLKLCLDPQAHDLCTDPFVVFSLGLTRVFTSSIQRKSELLEWRFHRETDIFGEDRGRFDRQPAVEIEEEDLDKSLVLELWSGNAIKGKSLYGRWEITLRSLLERGFSNCKLDVRDNFLRDGFKVADFELCGEIKMKGYVKWLMEKRKGGELMSLILRYYQCRQPRSAVRFLFGGPESFSALLDIMSESIVSLEQRVYVFYVISAAFRGLEEKYKDRMYLVLTKNEGYLLDRLNGIRGLQTMPTFKQAVDELSCYIEVFQEVYARTSQHNAANQSLENKPLPQFDGVDIMAEFTEAFAKDLHFRCDAHEEIMDDLTGKKRKTELSSFVRDSLMSIKWFCNLAAFCCSKDSRCTPETIRDYVRNSTTMGKDARQLSLYHVIEFIAGVAESAAKDGHIKPALKRDAKTLFELFKRIA